MTARLDGVEVRRGAGGDLGPVDLHVAPGTATAIVGGDGAGGTTLLQVLVGSVTPTAGRVDLPGPHRIGHVAASSGTWPDLTVVENLVLAGTAYGLDRARLRARVGELLEATGLHHARDRLAARLSGGMRQKLAFACAAIHDPALLVLDQPTTGVDPVSRAELWRLVSASLARGAATVFTTSDLDEAERADHVVVLDAGRVVAAGPPDRVLAQLPGTHARPPALDRAPRQPAEELLVLRDLVVRFGTTTAVDGVSLTVRAGEVVGLLGANGAGKTTAIRTALGRQRPSDGTVTLFGEPPARRSRRWIGYVPQTLGLWPDLTVGENLDVVAGAFGTRAPSVPPALQHLADTVVAELPLGLRRRVAFAAGLGHGPRLLVMDEPTSGVGPGDRGVLWDQVHAARDAGAGVLVTTHHMGEARHCDRVVVMVDGRVVVDDTLEGLLGDRWTAVVEADDWAEAFRRLDRAFPAVALRGRDVRVPDAAPTRVRDALGGLPARVASAPADLDEVFVALGRP